MIIMQDKSKHRISIRELARDEAPRQRLRYEYLTSTYFDLSIRKEIGSWRLELSLKHLEEPLAKSFEEGLFAEHVDEPMVFEALMDGEGVGWIELGFQKWNNRMRVWEFLVKEGFRRKGIGAFLMRYAIKVAKERGARMLVLETQTCNVPAISFYLKQGFELIGFDCTAYSNEDIKRKEVRLEMGLKL
jgi:ribosomal protein S18 acetylase RimI-like enzyme